MKLFFIFPLKGPNNGVKIISNHIRDALFKNLNIEVYSVDTSQARNVGNFGKFSFRKIFFILVILKKLVQVKRKDAVFLNFTPKGFAFYRDIIILFFCSIRTNNITIHVHANGLEEKIKRYNRFLFLKIKIIVINENQKSHIGKFCPNTFLLLNSLPDYFKDRPLSIGLNKPINLIFLSNVSKEKGLDRIELLSKIIFDNQIYCKLNVVGGALNKYEKKKINNLDLKYEFLTYHGPIKKEHEKFHTLTKNDLLVFLSDDYYEVYPLVYIEALMSGLPIITTKQIVSDNFEKLGVAHVLNKDLDNFAPFINQFIQNPSKLLALKIKARNTYKDNYSFLSYIEKIEQIILYDTKKEH